MPKLNFGFSSNGSLIGTTEKGGESDHFFLSPFGHAKLSSLFPIFADSIDRQAMY
jgi:hypothetical protein